MEGIRDHGGCPPICHCTILALLSLITIDLEVVVALLLALRVVGLQIVLEEPSVLFGAAELDVVSRSTLERHVCLVGGIWVGEEQECCDGAFELTRMGCRSTIVPSYTNFVRTSPIVLAIGFIGIARSGTCEVLEQIVVQIEATEVLAAIVGEPASAKVLEIVISDTDGVQLRIVRAVQIVDHIAAVLATVQQSRPHQIAYSGDEKRVLASLYAVALSILDEGLQLGHVARQAVEGELCNTVGLTITRECIAMSRRRVHQRHRLDGLAVSSNLLNLVYIIRIGSCCSTLSGTSVLEIERRILGHVARRGAEPHAIVGLEVEILMLGITIGIIVLHRSSHAGVRTSVATYDRYSELHTVVRLRRCGSSFVLCECCHADSGHGNGE